MIHSLTLEGGSGLLTKTTSPGRQENSFRSTKAQLLTSRYRGYSHAKEKSVTISHRPSNIGLKLNHLSIGMLQRDFVCVCVCVRSGLFASASTSYLVEYGPSCFTGTIFGNRIITPFLHPNVELGLSSLNQQPFTDYACDLTTGTWVSRQSETL